jgi:hypothetical protein
MDVAKGLCVVSMTFGHLARGTVVDRFLHLPPYVDGASGFILMSGLVLGMVQRQRVDRTGEQQAGLAMARRTRLIYGLHVALVMAALGLTALTGASAVWLPRVEDEGGWARATARVLLLQVVPPNVDVLSLYVVLFALAAVATALLVRGRLGLLVTAMGVTYLAALVLEWPTATAVGPEAYENGFSWAGWQLVFLSAFVAGWYWRQCQLADLLVSKRVMSTALCGAALLAACGVLGTWLASTPLQQATTAALFEKNSAGPGRALMAWFGFVVLYGTVTHVSRRIGDSWAVPFERMGRRSLDSYVLLTLIMLIAAAGFDLQPVGSPALLLAGSALAAITGWACLRDSLAERTFVWPPMTGTAATGDTRDSAVT